MDSAVPDAGDLPPLLDAKPPAEDAAPSPDGVASDSLAPRIDSAPPQSIVVNVADWLAKGMGAQQAIEAALAAANPGDTVYLPAGTYEVTSTLKFKSGVNVLGDASSRPILSGADPSNIVKLEHTSSTPLQDVTIKNVRFQNIQLRLHGGSSYNVIRNITLFNCEFYDGRVSDGWGETYLQIGYTTDVVIERCTFLRRSGNYGGRGVNIYRGHGTIIKGSFFGTTRNLEPATSHGYFKTAINVNGFQTGAGGDLRSEGVRVVDNVWRRVASPSCPYSDGSGDACQDHGLYAWGYKDLQIVNNYADGWNESGSGGTLKIRNGESATIVGNRSRDSGFLFYTYEATLPTLFHHAFVARNRIDMAGGLAGCGSYCGLVYWRNFGPASATTYEKNIAFQQNHLVSGGRIHLSNTNLNAFCLQGNTGTFTVTTSQSSGSYSQGPCQPAGAYHPGFGVFSGDFNGDGTPDFAYRHATNQGYRWRIHLSQGDGYAFVDGGPSTNLTSTTWQYGIHVADLNGDGRDDIFFRGTCGSDGRACWRVYRSTGSAFTASDWGDGATFTDSTLRYGLHVADFTGDGKPDVLYRGRSAADPSKDCWRLHINTGSAFVASDAGDGAYTSSETEELGVHAGDFNGDGKADLVYRGKCGSPAVPCWRVQLSNGTSLGGGQNWGDSVWFSPDTVHLGLRVGNANGDGKADLGYRGKCGSDGALSWRNHISNGSSFTVSCSTDNRF